ncbi:hypothetical protein K443DRAFT_98057 [Laccaria amethystina LaAM-08-1]|uniref:RBR-type E3 ubiquitin transferase n=1 Tax=Laccaria amethystina LaAM-08-1 TaxID=1095629 RepID=A0A0C9Y0V6_9AGAR|nr:hypothetical protein K443DRAFT_98057 [Laccaria amethystina LaAM-08-1]
MGPDLASSQLILRLTLEDIDELKEGRKGKARHDTPQTDSEYALELQAESARVALQVAYDAALAASIGEALMTDRECLIAIAKSEQAAVDDRRAAIAISKGEKAPEMSKCQKWVEDQRKEGEKDSSPSSSLLTDLEDIEESLLDFEELPAYECAFLPTPHLAPDHNYPHRVLCNSCHDYFSNEEKYLKLPCKHTFCSACLTSLVKACTLDETLFPLKCCNKPIDTTTITPYLTADLRLLFTAKCIEFGTPTASRLYCPNTKCSTFIPNHSFGGSPSKPSSASAAPVVPAIPCPKCHTLACPGCKQPAHPGDNCAENVLTLQVRQLAKREMWQTCPGCRAIVELRQGCYHIVCRCRTQFCYLCAAPWKTCGCKNAEENRLYARS